MDRLKKLLIFISELFNQKKNMVVIHVKNDDASLKGTKKQGVKKRNRNFSAMRWNKED